MQKVDKIDGGAKRMTTIPIRGYEGFRVAVACQKTVTEQKMK
jgi:hypothetical protein